MLLESLPVVLALAVTAPAAAPATAEQVVVEQPQRALGYWLAGVGLLEVAHAQLGLFVTPKLTLEASVAWLGVFGPRWGGGVSYTFGSAANGRPPRHGVLLGAQVMFDGAFAFDSHGDDLTSYAALPVGYAFCGQRFYFRATVAPVTTRERGGGWTVGGPFVALGFGTVF